MSRIIQQVGRQGEDLHSPSSMLWIIRLCIGLFVIMCSTIFAVNCDPGTANVIQNPSPFVIDGKSSVVLTCLMPSPVSHYSWDIHPTQRINCKERYIFERNCTYMPRVEDAHKKVICYAIIGDTQETASIQPLYLYPPRTAPNITYLGDIFGPGSVLKCEVSGGMPLVSNVVFTCDSPHHPDTPDVAGPGSVASYVTLKYLQDEDGKITCTCFANWTPRPDLYQSTSHTSLEIMYVTITAFTINKQHTREDAYENITLYCVAKGRPAPHVYLYNNTGHVISSNVKSSLSDVTTNSTAVISMTDCQQTGWYSCEANNSLPNGKQSSRLFMNVTCPPQAALNNSFINIPTISDNEVLNFTLKSNPLPHDFHFKLEAGGLNGTEDLPLSLYEFQASCSPDPDKPYLARCSVVAVKVPSDYLGLYQGLYNATAVSTEGNFSFLFLVNTTFIEEEANIIRFSINNNSTLITPEHTEQNVSLICVAQGRPTPNITLYDNTGASITSGFTSSITGQQKECSVTFNVTSCQQTGVYKCVANNALPNGQSESIVFVNVTTPPEAADSIFNSTVPIISLTSTLNFMLKANPAPHQFLFYETAAQYWEHKAPSFSDANEFNASCIPVPGRPYLARCSVKAKNVPSDYLGLYNATAVSTLGNFSFLFLVNTTVVKDKNGENQSQDESPSARTIAVAVIVPVASVCLIAAAFIIYCYIRRLRSTKERLYWHTTTKSQEEPTTQKVIEPETNSAANVCLPNEYLSSQTEESLPETIVDYVHGNGSQSEQPSPADNRPCSPSLHYQNILPSLDERVVRNEYSSLTALTAREDDNHAYCSLGHSDIT